MTHTQLYSCPLVTKILLFGLNLDVIFLCIHNILIDNFLTNFESRKGDEMIQLNSIIQLYDISFFSPGCFGDVGFLCVRNLYISNFLNKLAKNLNKT